MRLMVGGISFHEQKLSRSFVSFHDYKRQELNQNLAEEISAEDGFGHVGIDHPHL